MSTEKSPHQPGMIKKVITAVLVAAVFAAVVLYALIKFEYGARPEVYNALGLNPTVKWVGQDAPPFNLLDVQSGQKVSLKQLKGKVILLDFWASWCGSCLKQLPMIQKLHQDPKLSKILHVVSVNMKDFLNRKQLASLVKKRGYTFPVLKGDEEMVKRYKIWFFPALVLISPNGKVFYSAAELHNEAKIRKLIQQAAQAKP